MGLLNMIMGSDYDIPRDPFSNKHQDEADTATVPSSALAAMFPGQFFSRWAVRAHDIMIVSPLSQNAVVTSFWRNGDSIFKSRVSMNDCLSRKLQWTPGV